jgi:type IV pilus assembly protein PilB
MGKVQFEVGKRQTAQDIKQAQAGADDRGIIQKVDEVMQQAVAEGATEIHFEPQADRLTVRIRIKQQLKSVSIDIEEAHKTNVINRLKVLSGMDITRTKIPQNGFFKLTIDDKKIELYAYIMPTLYGETVIVRVQYKQSATLRIGQLGMSPKVLPTFQKSLARGAGLYLVTGPPGSGKRTTVYSAILEVLTDDKLAMGFDPMIKYEIPGMVQGSIEDKSEFTFAEGIRALMKQEPDVAYIGDITSVEEARAAIQGAFAKRIVLCRMTANDCVNAIQNLLDMGIQPFLVAASVASIINQRLLRKLCPACRVPYPADADIQKEIGMRLKEGTKFYRAQGCAECENTGYVGVQTLFEVYAPSEELNKLIVAKESVQKVRHQALQEGLVSLKMDGILKAMHGLVTLEDVLNAL